MSVVVTGIGELVTLDGPIRHDAAVVSDGGVIAWVGRAADAPAADRSVDVGGRAVVPGFIDTHTHLVFAGDRSTEFAARMSGAAYDGGGIASTVAATAAVTDDELERLVAERISAMRGSGTTTVEIKSGYGLDTGAEQRLLRIAGRSTPETTFLGAHVVPPGRDRARYLADVTGPDAGLGLRVHGNQLSAGPGVRLAVELGAASVDHCTVLTDADVDALRDGSTVATLLPAVEFATRQPYPDARRLLDAGVEVALATDCNPGTAYTSSMPFVIALAVREMGLTPLEALTAATRTAAQALRRSDIGVIRVGAKADLAVVDGPSHVHLAYRPGMPIARALELADATTGPV
jgi:imidazolonepropionase